VYFSVGRPRGASGRGCGSGASLAFYDERSSASVSSVAFRPAFPNSPVFVVIGQTEADDTRKVLGTCGCVPHQERYPIKKEVRGACPTASGRPAGRRPTAVLPYAVLVTRRKGGPRCHTPDFGLRLAVRSRPTGTEGDRPSAAERSGDADR
jgi:hypothetical protein